MKRLLRTCAVAVATTLATSAAFAAPVYLNIDNMSVSVGSGTGPGSSNNTFNGGQTIDKVIDAPSATASEDHTQTTHIWYTFSNPSDGLELIFDFGVSYDITTLHFWNYAFDNFSVDKVEFSFFNSVDQLIGQETIMPTPSGSESNITAQDYALVSPLNTKSVKAFLTGTNGQVDFQNIGFTATVSDPDLDPDPNPNVVPLPASAFLLLGGLAGLRVARGKKKA
ncbi:VPLPA-CTERM sorting domain-containing protein [Tropicimonas sp. S265A]|uniref:VPLPA-CTERM sorting domain-containing protein n=1 Tax=Tropicimonas sp. S265A TaxID=3415134 RepID=UPI003C7D20E1